MNIFDSIRITSGKPLDKKYLNGDNTSYISINEVLTTIPYSQRHVGLTVNIGKLEYWFKEGIEDDDLILKAGLSFSGNTGFLTVSEFNTYSGITNSKIDSKLFTSTFSSYTGLTESKINSLSSSSGWKVSGTTLVSNPIIIGSTTFLGNLKLSGITQNNNTTKILTLDNGSDVKWKDAGTLGSNLSFNNGLTSSGNIVGLGGSLTGNTSINANNNTFNINNTTKMTLGHSTGTTFNIVNTRFDHGISVKSSITSFTISGQSAQFRFISNSSTLGEFFVDVPSSINQISKTGISLLANNVGGTKSNSFFATPNLLQIQSSDNTSGTTIFNLYPSFAEISRKLILNTDPEYAALNIKPYILTPSILNDGDIWYELLENKFKARQNGNTIDLINASLLPQIVPSNGFYGYTDPQTSEIYLSTEVDGILVGNGASVSAAIPSDFPILNQNTTGSAATLTNSRTFSITGGLTASAVSFNGSANVSLNATVNNGHITLARMANLPANTIIGNNTGVSAVPLALSASSVTGMLNIFTPSLKGLVPPSSGGTSNFLRADGTWAMPAGGGGGGGGLSFFSILTGFTVSSGVTVTNTDTLIAAFGKLQGQINNKANLLSASFSGTTTAPTASLGTNTTQIATTAFVRQEIDEEVINLGTGSTGTITLDLSRKNFTIILTGNITLDYTNLVLGREYTLRIQRSTNTTISWASGKWSAPLGIAPQLTNPTQNGSSPARAVDILVFKALEVGGRPAIVITPDIQNI